MNSIIDTSINILSSKDIETSILPNSSKVDSRTFSRLLDDERVVASKCIGFLEYWKK